VESVPHPDSVELPVLALPVVEPVVPVVLPDGVLDGVLDAAGVEDFVLLDAGEDAPEPAAVVDDWYADDVVPEEVAEFAFEELDEDDGDE
jgi:hypothetical protein